MSPLGVEMCPARTRELLDSEADRIEREIGIAFTSLAGCKAMRNSEAPRQGGAPQPPTLEVLL